VEFLAHHSILIDLPSLGGEHIILSNMFGSPQMHLNVPMQRTEKRIRLLWRGILVDRDSELERARKTVFTATMNWLTSAQR